jgi:acyl carrier protein phosphodiesterase
MNLLAHALLSGDEPGVVVGGLLGDWIKGPVGDELAPTLAEGVRRHRRIDSLTDAHPVSFRTRNRLRERWGRYSGIVADLAYDFCLAASWCRFGPGTPEEFVARTHDQVEAFLPVLPSRAAALARRMISEEWMLACTTWEGVGATLDRVGRRLRRPVSLAGAAPDLERLEPFLIEDFLAIFPDLMNGVCASAAWRPGPEAYHNV